MNDNQPSDRLSSLRAPSLSPSGDAEDGAGRSPRSLGGRRPQAEIPAWAWAATFGGIILLIAWAWATLAPGAP